MSAIETRFCVVLRRLRESRGWSQELLAYRADINRSYFGEIERGLATPSLAVLVKIADALEIRLSELLAHCEDATAVPEKHSA